MLNGSLPLATLAFRVPPVLTLVKTNHLLGGGGGAPPDIVTYFPSRASHLQPEGGDIGCQYF